MSDATHDPASPVTDRVHDTSWSANLEGPEHADDPDLVRRQALQAVRYTTPGHHVNLVTHGDLGHPEGFLHDTLASEFGDAVGVDYVSQCGCGGHVTRVRVREEVD